MKADNRIKSTWIMITIISALAFIISGIIQLKYQQLIWPAVMKFSSALSLLLFAAAILLKSKRIFENPVAYVVLFFLGYVLILVGLMTIINKIIWSTGIALLIVPVYLAFKKRKQIKNK